MTNQKSAIKLATLLRQNQFRFLLSLHLVYLSQHIFSLEKKKQALISAEQN
jgi:hypothetical protein